MPRTLTIISKPPKLEQKKRVAAYARVSCGKDAMLHSLSAQVSYYSKFIQGHPEWIYAGVYVDEAKSGTKDNRDGFQRLIADCRAGKVDMILTKSISRFARNTVALLEIARECKAQGVDIYFEEQNIHTISGDGELMMTILASYAQEESLSVSENQKWRVQKNFKEGKPWSGTIHGYRCENGKYLIVSEEAALVQQIFQLYMEGNGYNAIAKRLNAEGSRTRNDKLWYQSTIMAILRNDAYTGDLLLQKTYRENHMTKRKRFNQGEHPMFRVEEAHEAIINKEMFEAVQIEIARRANRFQKPATSKPVHPFNGNLVCAFCGGSYHRKETHAGPVWTCGKYNTFGKSACESKHIPEDILINTTAVILGFATFDEPAFRDRVDRIQACNDNTLMYRFIDGTETIVKWKDKSRTQSWTDEMRETARQGTLERSKAQCPK
jgi:DNA invertase Pin-like site-specific DNA recombinase